jgi:hypothetical protein
MKINTFEIMQMDTRTINAVNDALSAEGNYHEAAIGSTGFAFTSADETLVYIDDKFNLIEFTSTRGYTCYVSINSILNPERAIVEFGEINEDDCMLFSLNKNDNDYYRFNDFWPSAIKCNKLYWGSLGITNYPEHAMLVSVCEGNTGVFDLVVDTYTEEFLIVTDKIQKFNKQDFFEFLAKESMGEY